MRLQLRHRTEYRYGSPITNNVNELRLTPPNTRYQTCESSLISVIPACKLTHYDDLNANRVHHFEIPEAHQSLTIDSRAVVSTRCKVDFNQLPYGFGHDKLPECRHLEECYSSLQDSRYIERNPEVWRMALDLKAASEDVFQTSYQIMEHIFVCFKYDCGATNVSTHASDVLDHKRGVCQDFAHAMIALCRSIAIPARYVSGYFFDATRDHSLRGSEASHGWVEVYIEGPGWIGFDPTNNKVVDDTYIVLARGRDYHDVAPVTGVYLGAGTSELRVDVQVSKLPDKLAGDTKQLRDALKCDSSREKPLTPHDIQC